MRSLTSAVAPPPPHPTISPRGAGDSTIIAADPEQILKDSAPPLPSGRGQGEGADSHKTNIHSHDITKRRAGKTAFARKLRSDETDEEYFLWSDIRNRRLNGHKFARQIPLGPYVVDFLCREAKLIIELDGGQHSESERDDLRTEWLNKNGYSVLRFWNNEVRFERDAVLETILAVIEGRIFASCEAIRFAAAKAPSPYPLPEGRGGAKHSDIKKLSLLEKLRGSTSPLPSGRGQGEGAFAVENHRPKGSS